MTESINQIQDEIVEEFSLFDDWADKYTYIIELGKKLTPLDESLKTDERIIKGCQSRVWLHASLNENQEIVFVADSDAIIVKGLVYLLIRVLSNQKPADIVDSDLYFMEKIGMAQHLSPTRNNGLLSMVKQMKLYGLALKTKLQAEDN